MKQIIESKLEQLKKGLSALENKRVPVNDVNLYREIYIEITLKLLLFCNRSFTKATHFIEVFDTNLLTYVYNNFLASLPKGNYNIHTEVNYYKNISTKEDKYIC